MAIKVLHINYNFVGTALHETMVQHLDPLVGRNAVFAPTWRDVRKNYLTEVKTIKCFAKQDRAFFHLKQHRIIKALESTFQVRDFNILHAYTLFTDGNCAYKMHEKYGIPYIVAIRDTDVNSFFKYMVHLRNRGVSIMKNAAAVIFLSESYKTYVLEKYVPSKYKNDIEKKSLVIPNGIDDFWIANQYTPKQKDNNHEVKIVFAGRINKRKNPLATVQALNILEKKGYKVDFEIIGKIEDSKLFKQLCKAKYVHYHEPCDKEKLIDYYRKNDLFVMPSKTETFGLVYAEAMSQGLPVLYSKGQGFDGQFADGCVGYAINKNDPYDIAEHIIKVLDRYSNLSCNCIMNVSKFDWNRIVYKYVLLYESILKV